MNTTYYIACDLGAEAGRVMLGTLAKGHLTLTEIHRFDNKTLLAHGRLYWDLASLEKEIFVGIEKVAQLNLPISGLSADSCGVDYVLLDDDDRPLQSPACGRNGVVPEETSRLLKKLSLSAIYAETGIPLLPIHTLFRLEAEQQSDPALFRRAHRFLPIADYLNTRFSGVVACEESLASTTQLYNPQTHAWSPQLVAALDLPASVLPRLVPSGTAYGPVIDELRKYPALLNTRVVATCSHDTAAAIAAVPARTEQPWAFLHSHTRSQLGIELSQPIMSCQAREDDFTNEVGLGGSIRFLKDGAGLGLVDECRRAWETAGQSWSHAELLRFAAQSGPAPAHVNLEHPLLHEPGDLPTKIARYCRETAQSIPIKPGETIRVVLESLALQHAETLRRIKAVTGHDVEVLHVVGRGADNDLLNQLIADAAGIPVIAGPVDAAPIGNILIQALALWQLKSPDHLRSIVSSSFPTRIFKPSSGFEQNIGDRFHSLEPAGV